MNLFYIQNVINTSKKKIIKQIQIFIIKYKHKANKHDYHHFDDVKCFKLIYALAHFFPVNKKYQRNIPEIESLIQQLWLLYFYFKHRIDGKNYSYKQIVNKYC